MATHPEYRSILAVDIESFGMRSRTNPIRLRLRRRLLRTCISVLHKAGVGDGRYTVADTGDGYLFFIEPQAQKSKLLDAVITRLGKVLEAGNRDRPVAERMRLRVAFHAGDVLSDPEHMHGNPTIVACRLLDSAPLRATLRATAAPFAMIVSDMIYEDIVKHGYGQIDPDAFHAVAVREKEARVLAWVHVPGDPGAPLRAGVAGRAVPIEAASGAGPAPRELPSMISPFAGRRTELAWVRGRLRRAGRRRAGAVTVVIVHGVAGVGKSALAVQAAHQVAHLFPDGQLYANLGAERGQPPLEPRAALDQLLSSLGERQNETRALTLRESAAHYRSALAGRRVLILLDNASSSAQISALLPGSGSCAVLITSRSALDELDGAARLPLHVLEPAEATELLLRCVGSERIAREPAAVAEVCRYCDYLPLALRIVAARLAARPGWTVQAMARRLADQHRRLDELRRGDLAVRASFEMSYQMLGLEPRAVAFEAARAFRLLGLLDGGQFALSTAAALLDRPAEEAEGALELLVDEHLLESPDHGWYRFHDLLRLWAREHAEAEEPAAARIAAITRMVEFYVGRTQEANRLIRPPSAEPAALAGRDARPDALPFADLDEALAWLEREYASLVGAIYQAVGHPGAPASAARRLAHAMFTFFTLRNSLDDWERVSRGVLAAARRDGDLLSEARAYNALGCIAQRRHDHGAAVSNFERSLELRRQAGDRYGEAGALCNLGISHREQGRHADAIACYRRSLEIYVELGDQLAEGEVLNNLGNVYRAQGRHDIAIQFHRRALAMCQATGDLPGEVNALHSLGQACHALGRYGEALDYYARDLDLSLRLGDIHGRAVTLHMLGLTRQALGQEREAAACWREALATFERLEAPEADAVRALLSGPPSPLVDDDREGRGRAAGGQGQEQGRKRGRGVGDTDRASGP
jgi:tetratricopeptide (TPR) repeat protein